ncbi:DUF11 domain-containing protein [Bacillus solitudinis]|uniref:DUF11 domain-containing protein n=1 Tax=Bacillus solitudinis TaxID=2014074 RepID=UPI000C23C2AC|nr:DUF11 domain-containing protein [Bacillus solitudinis]
MKKFVVCFLIFTLILSPGIALGVDIVQETHSGEGFEERDYVGEGHIEATVDYTYDDGEAEGEYQLNFTIQAKNHLDEAITDVLVELQLPQSVTVLTDTLDADPTNNIYFSLGDLEANEEATFERSAFISGPEGIGNMTINARVAANGVNTENDNGQENENNEEAGNGQENVVGETDLNVTLTGVLHALEESVWETNLLLMLNEVEELDTELLSNVEIELTLPEGLEWVEMEEFSGFDANINGQVLTLILHEDTIEVPIAGLIKGDLDSDFNLSMGALFEGTEVAITPNVEVVIDGDIGEDTNSNTGNEDEDSENNTPVANGDTDLTETIVQEDSDNEEITTLPQTGSWMSSWLYLTMGSLFIGVGTIMFIRFKPVKNYTA